MPTNAGNGGNGDLRGLRGGDYVVERRGFEDPACGEKRSLQHWSEKKRKKENKKLIITCMPANAGNSGGGCGD